MSFDSKVDVLVVGARCAGAATAMLMARAGLKVLAIDRGAYGSDTLSTHALMRGGVLQLRRWGVLPRVVARATPPVRRVLFGYGDETIEVPIRAADGVDALYAPRRTLLDAILVDAALDAGAEVRHRHTVVDLLRRADGRVRGATVLDAEGRRHDIAADLVVGADGVGSAVARLAGAPVLRTARHSSSIVYGYWPGLPPAGYRWLYRVGASVGVIPTNAGLHCIFVSIPPARYRSEFRADPVAAYRRVLAELSPELAGALRTVQPDGRLSAFAGRPGFLRQPAGPGWALVGDAGYFKDPLTAHGITDALRDAELLAQAAIENTPAAFAGYAALRDSLSLPLFEATEAIAGFGWDLPELRGLHEALQQAMKSEVALLSQWPRLVVEPPPLLLRALAAVPC